MTLAEYIRLTLLAQESEAEKKAWKKLIKQHREDSLPAKQMREDRNGCTSALKQ